MNPLSFLSRLSKREQGVNDNVTKLINEITEILVYKIRKENSFVAPKIRITVWIPRENGETMQIERETRIDMQGYEESYQNAMKKK